MITEATYCCGIAELGGLGRGQREILMEIVNDAQDEAEYRDEGDDITTVEDEIFAFYIWGDAVYFGNGQQLADYIKKNKLGTVTSQRARRNANSGRMIKCWVWGVNKKALLKWYDKQ